jgi:hypothetical protein
MGLDMYLYARKGISSFDWEKGPDGQMKHKQNADYKILTSLMGASEWAASESSLAYAQVSIQVGYWRKVNAIHNWFIENLADGEDNCQAIYVPRSSLIDLKITCEEVLKDHSKAEELLPTGAGFFFGSTEYDEWYFNGVEITSAMLSRLIEDVPEGWAFEYQASW